MFSRMASSRPRGQETISLSFFLSFCPSGLYMCPPSRPICSRMSTVSSAQETIHYGDRSAYLVTVRSVRERRRTELRKVRPTEMGLGTVHGGPNDARTNGIRERDGTRFARASSIGSVLRVPLRVFCSTRAAESRISSLVLRRLEIDSNEFDSRPMRAGRWTIALFVSILDNLILFGRRGKSRNGSRESRDTFPLDRLVGFQHFYYRFYQR